MDLLKKILNNLALAPSVILSNEEGKKYPKEFEMLLSLGLLKQDTYPQGRWCPSCEGESVPIKIVSKERAYTLCTTIEETGRDYFDPQTLQQWRFNTPLFISLFLSALGINDLVSTENITGLLWDFGNQEINGKKYHLFFTRSIDNIEKDKRSIITSFPDAAVFYLGVAHTSLPDGVLLVPVLDVIKEINDKGFGLNSKILNSYFPKKIYSDASGDLELDKDIVLSQKNRTLLFHRKRGGGFSKSVKISPAACYLIAHCYQIRKNDIHAKKLQELAENLTENSSKSSVSNRIKQIKNVCDKEGTKQILIKYSGEKWGLNNQLDCCK